MTAIRDITNLFTKRLCRIVFVKDRQAATSLTDTITAQHPEYICAASEQFNDYKQFGPFKQKNKDSLSEMLSKTETFREMRKATDLHSAYAMMEAELAAIDCLPLQYRSPRGMSAMQKLRSFILCDILNGNFHFVLNDCAFDDPSDSAETRSYRKKGFLTIVQYIKQYAYFEHARRELVWVTDLSINEMLSMLGPNAYRSDFFGFYTIQDSCVIALDKAALIQTYEDQNGITLPPLVVDSTLDQFDEGLLAHMILEEELPLPERRKAKAIQEFLELAIKKNSAARLSILEIRPYKLGNYLVKARLQAGTISQRSQFRSLRTGYAYGLVLPPFDITYGLLQGMLTGSDSIEDMADDFKVIGYDINSVRAYSESKSSQSADEFFARKVSVGDSGSFTCVGLCAIPENAKEKSSDSSKELDVQVKDIWEAIPNAE